MESSARRPGGATWSTRTTGCYSALKRKDVLTPATTWVNWRPLCCTEQASRRRTNTVGVHAREGSRRVNSTEAGGHQGLGDGARGAVANGDGELVWGDEIVLEMTVVMLRGHVNVLNGPELKHLQTVKTEDFILCVFYHNFYLKKKRKKKKKGNSQGTRDICGSHVAVRTLDGEGDEGSPGQAAGRRAAVPSWVLILPRPSGQAGGAWVPPRLGGARGPDSVGFSEVTSTSRHPPSGPS